MTMLFRFTALSLAATLILTGCSGTDQGRMEVAGTVKLKGSPLKDGIVLFDPVDGQDTSASTQVVDGGYNIPREYGLKPGKYLVRVTAGDGKTAVNPVDPDEPPGPGGGTNIISKDLVPASWNTNSKQQVTVTTEGPNKFDFDIK